MYAAGKSSNSDCNQQGVRAFLHLSRGCSPSLLFFKVEGGEKSRQGKLRPWLRLQPQLELLPVECPSFLALKKKSGEGGQPLEKHGTAPFLAVTAATLGTNPRCSKGCPSSAFLKKWREKCFLQLLFTAAEAGSSASCCHFRKKIKWAELHHHVTTITGRVVVLHCQSWLSDVDRTRTATVFSLFSILPS